MQNSANNDQPTFSEIINKNIEKNIIFLERKNNKNYSQNTNQKPQSRCHNKKYK